MENLNNSLVANDINELGLVLTPRQLLVDSETGHLYVVNPQGELVSVTKEMAKELSNKLDRAVHMKSDNQHVLATEDISGFMAPEYVTTLKQVDNTLRDIISNGIVDSRLYERNFYDGMLCEIDYTFNGDIMSVEPFDCLVGRRYVSVDNQEVVIPDRPAKDFVSANGEVGVRYDLVYLEVTEKYDESYSETKLRVYSKLKLQSNVDFSKFEYGLGYMMDGNNIITNVIPYNNGSNVPDTRLLYRRINNSELSFIAGDGTEYSKGMLGTSTYKYALPLLKLTVLNDGYVSMTNPNGKLTDVLDPEIEICNLYNRVYLNNVNGQALLIRAIDMYNQNKLHSTNRVKLDIAQYGVKNYNPDGNDLCYIRFDRGDNDIISGISLGAKLESRYSKLGRVSRLVERAINSIHVKGKVGSSFTLDLIMCNISNNENVVCLYDDYMSAIYKVAVGTTISIYDKDSNIICETPLLPEDYNTIKITYGGNSINIYGTDNVLLYTKNVTLTANTIAYIGLEPTNASIHSVRFSNIIKNDTLFDNVTVNGSFINGKVLLGDNPNTVTKNVRLTGNVTNVYINDICRINPMIKPVLTLCDTGDLVPYKSILGDGVITIIVEDLYVGKTVELRYNVIIEVTDVDFIPPTDIRALLTNTVIMPTHRDDDVVEFGNTSFYNNRIDSTMSTVHAMVLYMDSRNETISIDSKLTKLTLPVQFNDNTFDLVSHKDEILLRVNNAQLYRLPNRPIVKEW